MLSALPVPVVLLDPENRVSFCQSGGRAVPRRVAAAIAPDDARRRCCLPDNPLFALLAQVRLQGSTISDHDLTLESPRLHKRGTAVQATALLEEPGCVLLTLQDSSAARALDRQILFRGAARSVTGMSAVLAHEVKNPLSGIRGAAQLLEASVVRRATVS